MVQKIYWKMHHVSCTNTRHDVTDFGKQRMVKNTKTWIAWERNIIVWSNKKKMNLWHILINYCFVAEVTFNVLYNLILNMGMFTYHIIKIYSKILPLSYPQVDICLQNWRPLFVDIVFTRDACHSNLRKRFFHQHQVYYNGTKKGQRPL